MPGALDMGDVMATVRERLPAEAIFTNGAGNFSIWAHRFYEFRRYPTQLAPRAEPWATASPPPWPRSSSTRATVVASRATATS